jgi:hypothetical protein
VRYLISHDAEGRIIGWSMASAGQPVPDGCIELDREPDRDFDRVIDGRIVDTFDPRIAAEREAEFERIAELFPTLRDAVPPVPIERQNGKFRFAAREVFDDFAARVERGEWTLPPADPRTLVGPFRAVGACLAPVGCNGSLYWFDPTIPARDDDIVLVRWDPRTLEALIRRCRHRPEWVATYGERPGPIATKLLKAFGGQYWLVTNESTLPLGRNRILGVLRRAEHDGQELHALAVRNIQPGAVLSSFSTSVAGPLSVVDNTGPAFTAFTNVASLAVGSYSFDTVQVVTVNGNADMTNNATTQTSLQVTMYDSTLTAFIPNQFVLANQAVSQGTLRGPFSFELVEAVTAGTSRTWNVDARVVGDALGTITGNVSGVTFKVEVHKRA